MQKIYYCQNKDGKEQEFIVRSATQGDLIEILKLYKYILKDVYPEWFSSSEDTIANAVMKEENEAIVVIRNNRIVAFGDVFCDETFCNKLRDTLLKKNIDIPNGRYCMIDDIFVHRGYRGFGLQKILLNELCESAANKEKDVALITVHPNNYFSENNIDKAGFVKVNEKPLTINKRKRNYWLKIVV